MKKLTKITAITTLIFSTCTIGQTIQLSETSKFVRCNLIENKLSSFIKKHSDELYNGYYVGYKFLGAPIASKLIVSDLDTPNFSIDNTPKLQQTESGCFISFQATTINESVRFFKPTILMRTGPRSKVIAAELTSK
jgi:hypothetical protein